MAESPVAAPHRKQVQEGRGSQGAQQAFASYASTRIDIRIQKEIKNHLKNRKPSP